MQRSAIVFLVLLRLAIGWHFFYEGALKVRSTWMGRTVTNRPFSSAGYFREAPGPLGKAWRWQTGDPDTDALAHLSVKPLEGKTDPAAAEPQKRMPEALNKEWDDYLQLFKAQYNLTSAPTKAAEAQTKQAEDKIDQAKAKVVEWLSYFPPAKAEDQEKDAKYPVYTSEQTHTYSSGEVKRRMSMAERIDEYRAKLDELHDASQRMWTMVKDVEGPRLLAIKADIARMRTGLLKDLDEQSNEMKKSLESILTPEQKKLDPVATAAESKLIDLVDLLTEWGLLAIGACLLLGLLTRTSAWLGAGFLLMTYLTVPPWPWLPSPPLSEGSYLFVNKNVVEMLALCVVATTYTGRWFGVDGLIYTCWCGLTGKQPVR